MRKYRIVKEEDGKYRIQEAKRFLFWTEWEYLHNWVSQNNHCRPSTTSIGESIDFESAREVVDNLLHPSDEGSEVVGVYTKDSPRNRPL